MKIYNVILVFGIVIKAFLVTKDDSQLGYIIDSYNSNNACIPAEVFWKNYSKVFVPEPGKADKVSSGPKVQFYLKNGEPIVRKVFDVTTNKVSSINSEIGLLFKFQGIKRVVRMICCTFDSKEIAIFMRRLSGNLGDKIKEFQNFRLSKQFRLLSRVTQSFAQIHGMQYVHSDIKSENMMFNQNKTGLKIIDFGMTTRIGERCKGYTPFYVSPELISSNLTLPNHYNQDVWSILVTVYEVLIPGLIAKVQADNNNVAPKVIDERIHQKMQGMLEEYQEKIKLPVYDIISPWFTFNPGDRPSMFKVYEGLEKLHILAHNKEKGNSSKSNSSKSSSSKNSSSKKSSVRSHSSPSRKRSRLNSAHRSMNTIKTRPKRSRNYSRLSRNRKRGRSSKIH